MDTCSFNKLHYSRNKNFFSVADSINLNLFASDISINKHGLILINLNGGFQVMAQMLFLRHNLHSSATKNKAGSYKHGIADFFSRSYARFDVCDCPTLGLRNLKLRKQFFKCISVFRFFNGLAVCSDNIHASVTERLSKVDCCLTAESCDNTHRLFKLDDIHNIFNTKRLKIELIGAGVIG